VPRCPRSVRVGKLRRRDLTRVGALRQKEHPGTGAAGLELARQLDTVRAPGHIFEQDDALMTSRPEVTTNLILDTARTIN